MTVHCCRQRIQAVIDQAAQEGGGVICIPQRYVFIRALFFQTSHHLYLEKGAVLKGSDDISHLMWLIHAWRGWTWTYLQPLVNAMRGGRIYTFRRGKINGNGLRFWKSFGCVGRSILNVRIWRNYVRDLVYIADSKDVQLSGVRLENSLLLDNPFIPVWECKLLNLSILLPVHR